MKESQSHRKRREGRCRKQMTSRLNYSTSGTSAGRLVWAAKQLKQQANASGKSRRRLHSSSNCFTRKRVKARVRRRGSSEVALLKIAPLIFMVLYSENMH
jgi:hypothetical protein